MTVKDDLYRQEILEHYRHPQNYGRFKRPTFQSYKINPLCGDEIDLQLRLDSRNQILDARFAGSGCALSIASASLLTEWLKGKDLSRAKKLNSGKALKFLGAEIGPARHKCALLAFDVLQQILKSYGDKRTSPKKITRRR
ncbi:MAG: iron-sulfur cluster assembly scaffold protein [Patescibacteria group bacterium]